MRKQIWLCLAVLITAYAVQPTVAFAGFMQFNLVSDLPIVPPPQVDPNMKNPWGMSFGTTATFPTPFWISNQLTKTSTLYNPVQGPLIEPLVVKIPASGGPPAGPTGQVFNSTASDFMIPALGGGTKKSVFLFDTLDGNIEGWNPGSTGGLNSAVIKTTAPGAVFTGLALGSVGTNNYLYAADAKGLIWVYDGSFNDVTGTTFAGKFVDPSPVAGFTPFNIQNLGGDLYVTYAAATAMGVPLPGGYVDEFDTAGNFIKRIATGGPLNAPWGLAIAPAGFGSFANDLLVGNLFDSKINAFNPATDALDGSISVSTGFASPVGLWAIMPGNGTTGRSNFLYFTSGINDQSDGLFGFVAFVPEPGSFGFLALGVAAFVGYGWRRRIARG
jgi:uncharacterized protein (TIGR03118 family)